MRILVLNWRDMASPQAGGAEVHLHEVFRRIVGRGHKVRFLTTRYAGLAERETFDGIEVRRVGHPTVSSLAIPLAARSECRRWSADLVVDCLNKLPFYAPLWVRAPTVALVHHLPGASAFCEVQPPVAAAVCGYELPLPFVYRRTPVLTISESSRRELIARGLQPAQVRVIDLGVDHGTYRPDGHAGDAAQLVQPSHRAPAPGRNGGSEPRANSGDKAGGPVVLCVGRVRRYKRVDHAIRAIKRVREQIAGARLVVVGEGRDEARLKGLARAAGVQDAVEFAGRVSEQEKVDWIRRSALLLSTSAKEGWGLTVIEANACGVPAVAYDVPGLRDSIRPDTGCLVASGDVAKLAEAVMALLNDEPRRQECCRRAVAWAARFTWDRCAAETLEALQDAVQARA